MAKKAHRLKNMNFSYQKKKLKSETLVKRYDLLRPSCCLIEGKSPVTYGLNMKIMNRM